MPFFVTDWTESKHWMIQEADLKFTAEQKRETQKKHDDNDDATT